MMKGYIEDWRGKVEVRRWRGGVVSEAVIEPSQEFIDKLPPNNPLPEPRDYLAEIDELKGSVKAIRQELKRMAILLERGKG